MKQPIRKDSRWNSAKPVVVFGVISPTRGVVHWHFGEHSFNAQNICDALQEVRVKVGDGVKLSMMWDNARIHRARITTALMRTPAVDIAPIWNVAARPDLATVGIEQVWARAKYLYRQEVDRFKALNRPFHHMGLVQSVMGQITNEYAMRLAAHSVPAVMAAEPIQPLPNELPRETRRRSRQADETTPRWIHHSPNNPDLESVRPISFDDGFFITQSQQDRKEGIEDALLEEME